MEDKTNYKKTYLIWFAVLVLPPILLRIGFEAGEIAISEDLAAFLTIVSKIGAIILTIWYALKTRMQKVWAWILGLSTLLPFMVWVSLLILLSRKPLTKKEEEAMQKFGELVTDYKSKMASLKEQERRRAEDPEGYKKELFAKEKDYLAKIGGNPKDSEAYMKLSEIYMHKGENKEAIKYLKRFVESAEDDFLKAQAKGMLALAYYQDNQKDNAKKTFTETLKLNPDDGTANHYLGLIFLSEGKLKEATEHIERAFRNNPDDPDTAHNLALVYERNEDYEKSLSQWKKYLEVLDKVNPQDKAKRAEAALQRIKELENADKMENVFSDYIKNQEKVSLPQKGKVNEDQFSEVMALVTLAMMGDDPLKPLRGVEGIDEKLKQLDEQQTKNVEWEMLVLFMFIMTSVCRGNGISDKVLDKIHRRLYGKLAEIGLISDKKGLQAIDALVNERYQEFQNSLRNEAGAGPMWHFGSAVTKNMFGEKDSMLNLMLPLVISTLFVEYGKAIKETIKDYPLEK